MNQTCGSGLFDAGKLFTARDCDEGQTTIISRTNLRKLLYCKVN